MAIRGIPNEDCKRSAAARLARNFPVISCKGRWRIITNNVRKFPIEPIREIPTIMAPVIPEISHGMMGDTATYSMALYVIRLCIALVTAQLMFFTLSNSRVVSACKVLPYFSAHCVSQWRGVVVRGIQRMEVVVLTVSTPLVFRIVTGFPWKILTVTSHIYSLQTSALVNFKKPKCSNIKNWRQLLSVTSLGKFPFFWCFL